MADALSGDALITDGVARAVREWGAEDDGYSPEDDESFEEYRRYIGHKWLFMALCALGTLVAMGVALTIGEYPIGFVESYEILIGHIIGQPNEELGGLLDHIIINLRLPRIVIGIVAGAGLAIAGAAMQSTLLNPLADSYTTGVSSGASFGATVAMTLGIAIIPEQYAVIGNAFVFSLIPTLIIVVVSRLKNASPTVMIMSGIAVMYIFNACTTVMMLWASPSDLEAVYRWQVGTLEDVTWDDFPIMFSVVLAGAVFMQLMSRKINVLATGEDNANALGINATKLRTINLIVVALMTASIVSFLGIIGFVGLVAPHIVRIFIGPDNRFLIPASACFGAVLMVAADLVGRTIIAPATLQVGVVLAFIGGPMFLWLIMGKKSRIWGRYCAH